MLIAPDFVLLNMPKTGSTFARTVLKAIHEKRADHGNIASELIELILPSPTAPGRPADQHGTYRQIPSDHAHKAVVSIARNLYDKFLSTYRFGFWAIHPPLPIDALRARFPHFPDLSFDEYVEMNLISGTGKVPNNERLLIGNQTIQFIRMYCRNPEAVIAGLSFDDETSLQLILSDLGDVRFLRCGNINDDMANYLAEFGYSPSEVDFCRCHPPVNAAPASNADLAQVWTPIALDYVGRNERLLFAVFSTLGIADEFACLPQATRRVSNQNLSRR